MQKVIVFNHLSLDGKFCDADGGLGWTKRDSEELTEHVRNSRDAEGLYLFGRKTYEMFAGFWPTPAGKAANPYFAKILTEGQKVVFSRTLGEASWANTAIEATADEATLSRWLAACSGDALIFGSGSLVRELLELDLIDEYQVVINPIMLGAGQALFSPLSSPVELELLEAKPFRNGTVLLRYRPLQQGKRSRA